MPYVSPRADLFHQLLAAILSRRRRKITKPPILGRAQINRLGNFGGAQINPPRQLWARPYQSARQLWARPYQSVRQQATTIYTSPFPPHIASGSLLLFVYTADPPSPSDQGQQRPTYPSSPFEHGILGCGLVASIWPFGDNTDSQTEV